MRIWFKMFRGTHMLKDMTVEDAAEETRTHKIFQALEQVCYAFDLGKPIWLEKNINEFKAHSKTRFYQDNFVEEIEFDYLEMQVLEED